MKKIIVLVVLLSSLNVGLSKGSDKNLIKLLKVSGMIGQFEQIGSVLESQMASKRNQFDSEEEFNQFTNLMVKTFDETFLKERYLEKITSDFDKDTAKIMLKLYQSELMKEAVEMELAANNPNNEAAQMAYFRSLQTNPPMPERVEMLNNLHKEIRTSDQIETMFQTLIGSMVRSVNAMSPVDNRLSEEEINTAMSSYMTPAFFQQMSSTLVMMSLYTYRTMSTDKLVKYVRVWQTPEGQYFVNKSFEAFSYAFEGVGERLITNLKEMKKI
ncbi:hypothetical protein [Reichenbachiella versicolor]|uniref:hypothetical protein n=1 Tax=Reichenbachiella versicolor TaxID=1821036 RepID=UPI000D6E0A00|nr:hypothetical protein [Reichenbachiella versicolor]